MLPDHIFGYELYDLTEHPTLKHLASCPQAVDRN